MKCVRAMSRFRGGSLEPVPDAADADDECGGVRIGLNLPPKRRKMGVHGPVRDVDVEAPHFIQELVARDTTPGRWTRSARRSNSLGVRSTT